MIEREKTDLKVTQVLRYIQYSCRPTWNLHKTVTVCKMDKQTKILFFNDMFYN